MTREQWKERLPLIQAFADGKRVQIQSNITGQWSDIETPEFAFGSKYRIAPEPKLRPWKAEEVPLGAWVRRKGSTLPIYLMVCVGPELITTHGATDTVHKFSQFMEFAEHSTDGGKTWKPCGVLEGGAP